MEHQPIIVEHTFDASPEKIWKALTDKDEMKKWYFDLAAFKPEPGFEFTFTGGKDDRTYLHLCRIEEISPERKLRHSWKYDGYEGISFVTWELFPEGDKTRLRLTHEGLESFPSNNPDFDRNNFVAGWNSIINESLAAYLKEN